MAPKTASDFAESSVLLMSSAQSLTAMSASSRPRQVSSLESLAKTVLGEKARSKTSRPEGPLRSIGGSLCKGKA